MPPSLLDHIPSPHACSFPPSTQTETLADTLRPRISGTIHTDEMTRALYARDASMYTMVPVAVLVPETKTDVQTALSVAHEQGVPVLPRGGGILPGRAGRQRGPGDRLHESPQPHP
jgi:FAD/FMN-containing dehydrogenases